MEEIDRELIPGLERDLNERSRFDVRTQVNCTTFKIQQRVVQLITVLRNQNFGRHKRFMKLFRANETVQIRAMPLSCILKL